MILAASVTWPEVAQSALFVVMGLGTLYMLSNRF